MTTTTDPTATTAGAAGTHAAADTAAADTAIAGGRARIDAIDAEIVRLLTARLEVSAAIQQVRQAHGGRRIEHSREMQVLDTYTGALGRPGGPLAMAVLELCRGRV